MPRKYLLFLWMALASCNRQDGTFICRPCNLSCDDYTFSRPGECPHCHMELYPLAEVSNPKTAIQPGSGFFHSRVQRGSGSITVPVYYHMPQNFTSASDIWLVIPGTGRSAEQYRDAWVEASEKYSLLIVAPLYPERHFPFEAYHLGGIIQDSNLEAVVTYEEGTPNVWLDEAAWKYTLNLDAKSWLFADFDQLFEKVVAAAVGSNQSSYSVFGHSAGGHIAHRLALLGGNTKAKRILAANASFYTLPVDDVDFPFGLGNLPVDTTALKLALQKNFTLLLGELDNTKETHGNFLRSPTADLQGLHRFARGRFFYRNAQNVAVLLGVRLNWSLYRVPGVGHDERLMSKAAAEYVYGQEK